MKRRRLVMSRHRAESCAESCPLLDDRVSAVIRNLYCKLGIKSKAELAALWPRLMGAG
jgi:hypothetical protein